MSIHTQRHDACHDTHYDTIVIHVKTRIIRASWHMIQYHDVRHDTILWRASWCSVTTRVMIQCHDVHYDVASWHASWCALWHDSGTCQDTHHDACHDTYHDVRHDTILWRTSWYSVMARVMTSIMARVITRIMCALCRASWHHDAALLCLSHVFLDFRYMSWCASWCGA